MDRIFSKEEVNTGRQREFDYLKGFFMIFIFLIHAFQATFSAESTLVSGIYIVATMTGAALFIFVMGFGTVYSKRSGPSDMAANGVRMVAYQYLNNLLYIAAIILPYPFVKGLLTDEGRDTLRLCIRVYAQYTNIFFITGIIYLVLALLKKLNCKVYVYPMIALVMTLIAPLVYGREVKVPVIGYIIKLLIGHDMFVSFTPLYFLSYALLGVAAGHMYRHIRDKKLFYRIVLVIALIVAAVWWTVIGVKYIPDPSTLRKDMGYGYIHPGLFRVAASLAHILIAAAVVFFINDKAEGSGKTDRKKENPISAQILFYGKHISKYYALHVVVYFVALGFHGYLGFEPRQCWGLMLLSMIVTEGMVRAVVRADELREKRGGSRFETILKFAFPYLVMLALLLLRLQQLDKDRAIFTPREFDTFVWALFVIMIIAAQVLYVVNKRMASQKAREDAFMETARDIQSGMVPPETAYEKENVRIEAISRPAKAVGGDFYDIIPLDDGRFGIVMGDVSGKGVPAALFMSMVKTMVRDRILSGMSVERTLNEVNDELCASNPKGMFATVFAGVFDENSGELTFANAGHMPPVKTGADASFVEVDSGCAIGLFEDAGIICQKVVLKKGEGILLYTDGTTEAVNLQKEPFGEKRLLQAVSGQDSKSLIEKVAADVIKFSGGQEQFDDLTLLMLSF